MSNWTSGPDDPVNFVQVVVGPTGSVGAPEQAVVDFIGSTFADGPKPDLIVAIAGPAAVFARKYRSCSFPTRRSCSRPSTSDTCATHRLGKTRLPSRSPTIFPASSMTSSRCCPRPGRSSWCWGPDARQFWRRELEKQFTRFHDRLTFVWFDQLSLAGDPAPLGQPARQLRDLLSHVRHGRGRSGVCGRASARRPPRDGQCTPVWGAQRLPGQPESSADR